MSYKKLIHSFLFVYILGIFCQNITFAGDFGSGLNEQEIIENIKNDEGVSKEMVVENEFSGETLDIECLDNNLLSDMVGQSGLVLDTGNIFLEEKENSINIRENFNTGGQDVEQIIESQNIVEIPTLSNSELIVSEVYFDGTDERIEIFNLGSDLFSGDLTFSGIKSSLLVLENIQIYPDEYIIIGDKLSSNLSLDNSYISQGLSISDTKSIDIKLFQNNTLLDSFFVSQDDVDIANEQTKTSFHKLSDTREILLSSSTTTTNTNDGYLANPGDIYKSLDLGGDDNSPGNNNTGALILPNIKITEVFPYGEDVWFELTNFSENDFSGVLIISGFDSGLYNFNIFISEGESRIISNNERYFQELDIVDFVSNSLQISLNSNLFLSLYYKEELLDSFNIDQTWLEYLDGFDSSFEKIGTGESWFTTYVGLNTDRYYNTNRGYAANPGKVFVSAENIIDVTLPKGEVAEPELTGLDMLCDDLDNSYLEISEYFAGDDRYPMYFEIDILDDRITDIFIGLYFSGTAITGTNPYFDFYDYYDRDEDLFLIDFDLNKKILLSNQDFRYDEMQDALFRTGFDIQQGLLELYGFDGEEYTLLDVVNISDIQETKSTYYDGEDFQCVKSFSDIDSFSPGFDQKYSKYFETIAIECPICNCGAGGTKYIAEFDSNEEQSSDIEISSIKYVDENNQIIKIKNKANYSVNMRDYSLQILVGDEKTSSFQGNTAISKSITSFVGSYGLPKHDSCINLMKDGVVVDRYCYATLSKPSEVDLQNISKQLNFRSELEDIELSTGEDASNEDFLQTNIIKITNIDYNPDGLDTNNETLTLLLLSGNQVDLADYKIQYIKDGKTTNKTINGILSYGNEQTFKGNYTFPNSTTDKNSVVVNILDLNDDVVDTYMYNPNKITALPEGEYEILSIIDGDTIKISYAQQEFNIRLAGIDAPESSALRCGKVECYGSEAKEFLTSLLEGKNIEFIQESTDDYDRFVGYVFLEKENINQKMIYNGYAREYSYKNQDYKYKPEFQSAQTYAKNNNLGLWGTICNGQRLCPVEETQVDEEYILNIENIIYDPDGNDIDNEEITISMEKGFTVNFADGFYLMINDTKKYLKNYGTISPGDKKTLKGSFSFPNSKKTTVSLFNGEKLFDTYIYDPTIDEILPTEEILSTGNEISEKVLQYTGLEIKIISVLPNPIGKDSEGEEIVFQANQNVFLDKNFYIKINNSKKSLENIQLLQNQDTSVVKNFSLLNSSSCVYLYHGDEKMSEFCYSDPLEGQKFTQNNSVLSSINVGDFEILKKIEFKIFGDYICSTIYDQKITCKKLSYSKLSEIKEKQNGFYKSYLSTLQSYLSQNWPIVYYNTDIQKHFSLYKQIDQQIKAGNSKIEIDGKVYSIDEYEKIYTEKYPDNVLDLLSNIITPIIPEEIKTSYQESYQKYQKVE